MNATAIKAAPHSRSAQPIADPKQTPALGLSSTLTMSAVNLYRLPQVLKRIPVSRSSWFAGIHTGRFPRGYNIGPRTTVWKSDEIDQVVAALSHEGGRV